MSSPKYNGCAWYNRRWKQFLYCIRTDRRRVDIRKTEEKETFQWKRDCIYHKTNSVGSSVSSLERYSTQRLKTWKPTVHI